MNADSAFILPDGRKLAPAEFGQPDGYPVRDLHTQPASR